MERVANAGVNDSSSESAYKEPYTVLGIVWHKVNDCLEIHVKHVPFSQKSIKRKKKYSEGYFDPLEFPAPVFLLAKLLIQEMWPTKFKLDNP